MSIDFYKEFGELGYLANYSEYGFYKDNNYYKTVEHYYQSEKFNNKELKEKIISSKTPKEASNIGRDKNNKRIDNFKNIKDNVMYEGCLLKFRQNKDIRSKLIETRNKEIREMTIDEYYWGVGKNLTGQNKIGKILMKVRDQVKEDIINKIMNYKNNKVYIIGHHKPDVDSIVSTYILTNILRENGIDAVAAVRDKEIIDQEIIDNYLDEPFEEINDYKNKFFILVDHNNLDGIEKENVIAAIDHHRITGEVEDLIEIEYASCALLIYDLFKSKHKFSDKEKILIGLSVLTDTEYLSSPRFSDEDKKSYDELNINLDVKLLQKKYFKTTDFNKEIDYNLKKDYKEYKRDNKLIRRSLIKSYTYDKDNNYDMYVLKMNENGIDLLIWCDYEKNITYINYKGENLIFPFFTTSSNLIIDELYKNENYDIISPNTRHK